MEYHLGRLVDHVHIVVSDLKKSQTFYTAILQSIGRKLNHATEHSFGCDELYVSQVTESSPLSHIHLAFQAQDIETVKRFHQAALLAGGKDNGAPGPRPYHPGYYGAFILDPDGNNIEAVYHGASKRSVESVIVEPA